MGELSKRLRVLVADDERPIREAIAESLVDEGYYVATAADGGQAVRVLSDQVFDVVIADVCMPEVDGLALLQRVRRDRPATAVILMSAFGSIRQAVGAIQDKAIDYLAKPFDLQRLSETLEQIAVRRRVEAEMTEARAQAGVAGAGQTTELVGSSPAITGIRRLISILAGTSDPVLITGESGTGKELVARRMHELSPRSAGPFVAVNCAAFPEGLFEAELFGHERGAFTGAVRRREGRFQAADGATLFLDEISEIPLTAQAKILRALQEGTFEPLGTNRTQRVDVRIVSATNRDLRRMVAEGRFRDDLYYRIKVLELDVPPLRERRADLPLLVAAFYHRYAAGAGSQGSELPPLSPRAWVALEQYGFPGNVRELEHAVRHALVLAQGGEIDLEHLPREIRGGSTSHQPGASVRPLGVAVKEFEREYLARALRLTGGNRTKAAAVLGISRKSLWEKLRDHGIADEKTGPGTAPKS
jgi:DNA-binding NtrC family response regulator